MHLNRNKAIVASNTILLVSLHVHAIAALRFARHNTVAQTSDKDHRHNEQLISFMQTFERAELDDMNQATGTCTYWSSKSMRIYHFELQTDDGTHVAMELIRSPLSPRIKMHHCQYWSVRYTGDKKQPLEWEPRPVEDVKTKNCTSVGTSEIDLLREVAYVERVVIPDAPDGISIVMTNGSKQEFVGGLYYQDQAVAQVLANTRFWVESPAGGKDASVVKHGGAKFWKKLKHTAIGTSKAVGAYVGTNGALLGFSFASAGNAFIGFLVWVGLPITTTLNTFLYSVAAGIGFGLTGSLVGVALGAALGVAVGTAQAIFHTIKMNQDMKLTASEKLYQKLSCHDNFRSCGDNRLVAKWRSCDGEELRSHDYAVKASSFEQPRDISLDPEIHGVDIPLGQKLD